MDSLSTYARKMQPIAKRIAQGVQMAKPDDRGFDFRQDGFIVFVKVGPIGSDDNKARRWFLVTDVWQMTMPRSSPADCDVLQMWADELL